MEVTRCLTINISSTASSTTLSYVALIVLAIISHVAVSQTSVKTLPGFPGELPYHLETGYVGVGDMDEVQLFYYFVESERSHDDPLLLWLTGGPGCSSFASLVNEHIGPIALDYGNSERRTPIPALTLNPYSWTKVANIIFLDQPVGTGYSYSNTYQGYNSSDTLAAADIYTFLRKWLTTHPNFQSNDFYLTGSSYGGIFVPIVAWNIANGNEAGLQPTINLKGYSLGNPVSNQDFDKNFQVPFAHMKGIISDELFESAKTNCNGEYIQVDPDNAPCLNVLKRISECTSKLYYGQILEPSCLLSSSKSKTIRPSTSWDEMSLIGADGNLDLLPASPTPPLWCRAYNYLYSYIWQNDKRVQNALGIREGTVQQWLMCNKSLAYSNNVLTSLVYHEKLVAKGYRVLIYSGDHDMNIPYMGTHTWIESLNLTIVEDWRPWFVGGQVAGYQMQYTSGRYMLTFATIKGAGHTASEYKPAECFQMIYRWLTYYSL